MPADPPSLGPTQTPSGPRRRPGWRSPWLLWAVLLLAAAFRLYGIRWDEGSPSHPEERRALLAARQVSWPESAEAYFNAARSPLNPRNRGIADFDAGSLPTTLFAGAAQAFSVRLPEEQAILGRSLSAGADLGVVLAVFALAATLYRDRRVALLGALLYGAAVLPIQHAHVFAADPFGNLFATLALLALARGTVASVPAAGEPALRSAPLLWTIAAGAALGFAAACKLSLLVLLVPAALGPALAAAFGSVGAGRRRLRACAGALRRGIALLAACALAYRVAAPEAFAGWVDFEPRWRAQVLEAIGGIDASFALGRLAQVPFLQSGISLGVWGLGPMLGLGGGVALVFAAVRLVRGREWPHLLPLLWIGATLLAFGWREQVVTREFLPLYAPLAVVVAWALREAGCWKPLAAARCARVFPTPSIWRYRLRWLFTGVVPTATLLWAAAYLQFFTEPFPRTEVSRWIHENIPVGTAVGTDLDVASLPPIPGKAACRWIDLPWSALEGKTARARVSTQLDEAEYLVVARGGLRGVSSPRHSPYPPSEGELRRALADGRLGFDLAAEFGGGMSLFGWRVPAKAAGLAAGAYNRPQLAIYKKSARYSVAGVTALFATVEPSRGTASVPMPPALPASSEAAPVREDPAAAAPGLLLAGTQGHDVTAASVARLLLHFVRGDFAVRHPLLAWCGALLALLLAGGPYAFVVFRGLPDRGAGICRLFALALPVWIVWFLAIQGWARFSVANLWIALAALTFGGLVIAWRTRAEFSDFLRVEWPRLLVGELIFWGAFAGFAIVRSLNPDLWHPVWDSVRPPGMPGLHDGVNPVVLAALDAPADGGGAGGAHDFGTVLTGAFIKAVGVVPSVGFNLFLTTFFALAAAAAFSVVRAMTGMVRNPAVRVGFGASPALRPSRGSLWPAFAGAAFVLLFGNLFQGRYLAERFIDLGRDGHALTVPVVSDLIRAAHGFEKVRTGGAPLAAVPGDLYRGAAQAIPVSEPGAVPPVTEFPFWSFLHAELHPHVVALPFLLALAGALLGWLRLAGCVNRAPVAAARIGLLMALSFLLGFFSQSSNWEWLAYGTITALVLALGSQAGARIPATPRALAAMATRAGGVFLPTVVLGWLAFRPFLGHPVSGLGALALWHGEGTPLSTYVLLHGVFLFVIVTALAVHLRDCTVSDRRAGALRAGWRLVRDALTGGGTGLREVFHRQPLAASLALIVANAIFLLALLLLVRASLSAGLVLGGFLAGALAVEKRREPAQAFAFVLVAGGFTLSLVAEFVVFAGETGRVNRASQFHHQIWILFALASAALLPGILRARRDWAPAARRAWPSGFGALCLLALLFPVTGTPARIADRCDPAQRATLDGLAFLHGPGAQHRIPDQRADLQLDDQAIRRLLDRVSGGAALLEMNSGGEQVPHFWSSDWSNQRDLPAAIGGDQDLPMRQPSPTRGVRSSTQEQMTDVQTIYRVADPGIVRALLD